MALQSGLTHKDCLLRLGSQRHGVSVAIFDVGASAVRGFGDSHASGVVRVKGLRRERQRSTERSRRSPNGIGCRGFEDLYTYTHTPIHPCPNP